MKRFLIITAFLLTTAGVCTADYDYYSKRDPQTCHDVLSWEIELIQESAVLSKESSELIIEKLKPGDNAPTFNKRQAYEVKKKIHVG